MTKSFELEPAMQTDIKSTKNTIFV